MKRGTHTLAAMAVATLVGCGPILPATPSPPDAIVLTVFSTTSAAPLIMGLTSQYEQEHGNITFDVQIGNHDFVRTGLAQNPQAYGVSYHFDGNHARWAAPMAQDAIAMIINPDNPVTDMPAADLRRIYQGTQRTWPTGFNNAGDDTPIPATIAVLSRESGSALRAEFERLVMGQRNTTPNAELIPSTNATHIRVRQVTGAIGYVPFSQLQNGVRPLSIDGIQPTYETIRQQIYPLRSLIYIIGQVEPESHYRAFVGWIQSATGQALVEQLGYIALAA